jgi:hypothetical protein
MSGADSFCKTLTYTPSGAATAQSFPDFCSSVSSSDILQLIATIKNNTESSSSTSKSVLASSATQLQTAATQFCCTLQNNNTLKSELLKAKEHLAIAQTRAKSTQNPAKDISAMGFKFPLGRPLRPTSVPFLIGFIFFFIIMSFALLLNLGSIQISYTSGSSSYGFVSRILSTLRESYYNSSWITIIVVSLVSMGIGAGIYYGANKSKNQ